MFRFVLFRFVLVMFLNNSLVSNNYQYTYILSLVFVQSICYSVKICIVKFRCDDEISYVIYIITYVIAYVKT